mmetsp:Transcript_66257/g.99891  ORF Transcript_66257/g.99891 Transcript_66257/m.99891 type:complete len:91 (-) Transcript_66257:1115-1387(-)
MLLSLMENYYNKKPLILSPKNFIQKLKGKIICVQLKWGITYKGKLLAFDSFLNLRITETEEWVEEKKIGLIGEIFIRCNNVSYIYNLGSN